MTVTANDQTPFGIQTRMTPSGARVVAASGEIDIATAPHLAAALRERAAGETALVLDLTGTTFLDSSGIRVLVEAHRTGEAEGVQFSVVPGPKIVRDLLVTTGVADHLTLLDAAPGP